MLDLATFNAKAAALDLAIEALVDAREDMPTTNWGHLQTIGDGEADNVLVALQEILDTLRAQRAQTPGTGFNATPEAGMVAESPRCCSCGTAPVPPGQYVCSDACGADWVVSCIGAGGLVEAVHDEDITEDPGSIQRFADDMILDNDAPAWCGMCREWVHLYDHDLPHDVTHVR